MSIDSTKIGIHTITGGENFGTSLFIYKTRIFSPLKQLKISNLVICKSRALNKGEYLKVLKYLDT